MNGDGKKPQIAYRVELEKKIEINKSFSERRNQAVALRILSYGLFGQKRYQNLYLTCSLNCFHLALKIANTVHQRVAGLAMIIKFQTVQVLEYYAEEVDGKYFEEKKFSKIIIKLTKNPTQDDKKEAGYNPGLNSDQIDQPITEVLKRKKDGKGETFERKQSNRPMQQNRKRPPQKGYRDERPPQRKSKNDRYRDNSYEGDDYRRGQKKTRGRGPNQRDFDDRRKNRQNRGNKGPKRGRYDDQDD